MKKIGKSIVLGIVLTGLGACQDFLNVNPNAPVDVPVVMKLPTALAFDRDGRPIWEESFNTLVN